MAPPFTAEDAKFWLELAAFDTVAGDKTRAPAYFKSDLGQIEEIEVLEGDRLRVSLKERFPFYLESLMNPRIKIAHPTHLMKERIEEGEVSLAPLDVELVGTGPFRLESYEKGSLLRVQRFDDYWEKDERGQLLPYLDGIEFIVMPDPSTMDAAIRAGRLDGGARGEGHYLSIERKQGYDNSLGDGVLYAEMQGGLFRLAFNVLKPGPWQDARVRQAISLWIDNQSAIPSALGGFGYLSPVLSPSNPFTSPDFATWPRFNPEQLEQNRAEARRLMEEAGYVDGFAMGYLCRARLIARCEFIHAQLSGLNIDLQIQVVDEGEWNRGRVSLDYDSQPGAHFTPPLPEATESVFGVYSDNPDAYAKHEDVTVTKMYDRLRLATTRVQRVAIWRELERYIVEEQAYVVPIAGTLQVVPYRTYVKGLVIPPRGWPYPHRLCYRMAGQALTLTVSATMELVTLAPSTVTPAQGDLFIIPVSIRRKRHTVILSTAKNLRCWETRRTFSQGHTHTPVTPAKAGRWIHISSATLCPKISLPGFCNLDTCAGYCCRLGSVV